MEINRASTLAKVLARDRALEARDRKDAAIEKGRLADHYAYPGSKNFPQAVDVIGQYLSDLVEAKISSIRDAYTQIGIPLTGQTVTDAMEALRSSLETVIAARVGSWQGSLALVQTRTGGTVTGGEAALAEAQRELRRQAAKLYEKAEAKLDVLLQSSLAASERKVLVESKPSTIPRTATVLRVLIASPSDVAEQRQVLTDVVLDWNATHSAAEGIVLMPVKWETHAHPATGDYPQGLINKQIVDDCDILIAAFWSRLGTVTPVAPSGTAEEIERLRSKGKNVLLYFSTAPLPQSHDPEQWRMLQEYQRTLQKDTLYWNFATSEELYRLASRHLALVIHRMTAEVEDDISPEKSSSNDRVTGGAQIEQGEPEAKWLHPDDRLIWRLGKEETDVVGLVLPFYNDAIRSHPGTELEYAKAHLIFTDTTSHKKVRVPRACWIGAEFDWTNFRPGDQRYLILAMLQDYGWVPIAIGTNRTKYDWYKEDGEQDFETFPLALASYTLEIVLIWGGNGEFREVYTLPLDLATLSKLPPS